jgi:hypothetical protein
MPICKPESNRLATVQLPVNRRASGWPWAKTIVPTAFTNKTTQDTRHAEMSTEFRRESRARSVCARL